ncbi:MAG: hypothetical protein M3Y40_01255, partial [Chloroflexota bacterium]|nr:hypothetical protein [Chloroflexota bacterium]
PTRGASAGQVRRRRGSRRGRATVEVMERPLDEPSADEPAQADELDLTAIGLAVFFVSLILVVGALLILPAIF